MMLPLLSNVRTPGAGWKKNMINMFLPVSNRSERISISGGFSSRIWNSFPFWDDQTVDKRPRSRGPQSTGR